MGKVRLLVDLNVLPVQVDGFVEMFKAEFISRSRTEEGCEFYELWQNSDQPQKMTIVEVWSSQAALDAHLAKPWFAEWAPKMEAVQATPLTVTTMSSVEDG